jgi:hypothetical protein
MPSTEYHVAGTNDGSQPPRPHHLSATGSSLLSWYLGHRPEI